MNFSINVNDMDEDCKKEFLDSLSKLFHRAYSIDMSIEVDPIEVTQPLDMIHKYIAGDKTTTIVIKEASN